MGVKKKKIKQKRWKEQNMSELHFAKSLIFIISLA